MIQCTVEAEIRRPPTQAFAYVTDPAKLATWYRAHDAGVRMLAAGWPDEHSIRASLIKPIDALKVIKRPEHHVSSDPKETK